MHTFVIRKSRSSGYKSAGDTKTAIVAAVLWVVVVAVGAPEVVLIVVVPRPAAQNTSAVYDPTLLRWLTSFIQPPTILPTSLIKPAIYSY